MTPAAAKSCIGCKWLYKCDTGYSNYTVENTEVDCAMNRNSNLPADEPFDWNEDQNADNWRMTNEGRCELYSSGPMVHFDVDHYETAGDFTDDKEVATIINSHAGREGK